MQSDNCFNHLIMEKDSVAEFSEFYEILFATRQKSSIFSDLYTFYTCPSCQTPIMAHKFFCTQKCSGKILFFLVCVEIKYENIIHI